MWWNVGGQSLEQATDQSRCRFGLWSVRVGPLDIHRESEAADAEQIILAQRGLTNRLAVEKDAVETIQVDHLPNALTEKKSAMTAAHIRQRQTHIGLAVPADEDVRLGKFHGRAGGLENQAQRHEVGRHRQERTRPPG